jgi:hypothetical protein
METVILPVSDLDTDDLQALEHVIGQRLKRNQQVIIQVVTAANTPAKKADAHAGPLPSWCDVYAGMTDEQVADAERVILQRADLTRSPD